MKVYTVLPFLALLDIGFLAQGSPLTGDKLALLELLLAKRVNENQLESYLRGSELTSRSEGNECFTDPIGLDYRGTVAQTKSGRTCQKWTSQTPRQHTRTPKNYPDAGLGDHNYCRNPDETEGGAWCYTHWLGAGPLFFLVPRWETCNVGSPKATCDK